MLNKIVAWYLYTFLIRITLSQSLIALDPNRTMTQYTLNIWMAENGLPQNSVYTIVQSADGFLWMGTQEGIVRFDGVHFVIFDKRNTPAIQHNYITKIIETRDGALWFGTNGGGLIRYHQGQWQYFGEQDGLTNPFILSFTEDSAGTMWIGTNGGGLFRYVNGQFSIVDSFNRIADPVIYCCHTDRSGRVWIGTARGLLHYDQGQWKTLTVRDGLSANPISAIYEDRKGRLWIGTKSNGVNVWDQGKIMVFTQKDGLSGDMINDITEDTDSNIWIATRQGITRYSPDGRFARRTIHEGLPVNHIREITEDREGSLWIGTDGGGLYRLKSEKFINITTHDGLSYDMIRAVYEDRQGNLLIGTSGGGLNIYDGSRMHILRKTNGLSHDMVWSVTEDQHGSCWIGTDGGGITVYDRRRFIYYNRKNGLSNDQIRAMLCDRKGRIWVGTLDGLNCYAQARWTIFTDKDRLPHKTVYSIEEGKNGTLWIGTGGGLVRIRDDRWDYFTPQDGLSSPIILTTFEDSAGVLWVGTDGKGLNCYKNGRWYVYGIAQGMFDDLIYRILEDDEGFLWMSCNKGLFKVRKEDLLSLAEGQISSVQSMVYTIADGMSANECNGRNQPSGWKRRDGTLCFPSVKGVVTIHPKRNIQNSYIPPVHIVSIFADGILRAQYPIPAQTPVVFPPGTQKIEIHYTALSFFNPVRDHFRYFLNGFEKQPIDAGGQRTAYYTNLYPGKYEFRVWGSNNDGVWNEEGSSVILIFEPYFYQTLWFYFVMILLAMAGMYALYRMRVRQIERKRKELEELVAQKTSQIELQKNKLQKTLDYLKNTQMQLIQSEKMSSLGQLTAGIAHEINNPIAFISSNLPFLEQHLREMQRLIAEAENLLENEQAKRFSDLLKKADYDYMKDDLYSMLESFRKGAERIKNIVLSLRAFSRVDESDEQFAQINHELEVTLSLLQAQIQGRIHIIRQYGQLPEIQCSPSQLNQVFMHIIRNAIQAIPNEGTISVSTSQEHDKICISIADTGCGMTKEVMNHLFEPFFTTREVGQGSGLGLSISYGIIRNHGGTIEVKSEPGKGSEFVIRLPIHQDKRKQ